MGAILIEYGGVEAACFSDSFQKSRSVKMAMLQDQQNVTLVVQRSIYALRHLGTMLLQYFLMKTHVVLLMAEILHQLIDSLSHYLQGSIHPRWCRISAINSMKYIISLRPCLGGGVHWGGYLLMHMRVNF